MRICTSLFILHYLLQIKAQIHMQGNIKGKVEFLGTAAHATIRARSITPAAQQPRFIEMMRQSCAAALRVRPGPALRTAGSALRPWLRTAGFPLPLATRAHNAATVLRQWPRPRRFLTTSATSPPPPATVRAFIYFYYVIIYYLLR
jgi:hypothetical protein